MINVDFGPSYFRNYFLWSFEVMWILLLCILVFLTNFLLCSSHFKAMYKVSDYEPLLITAAVLFISNFCMNQWYPKYTVQIMVKWH